MRITRTASTPLVLHDPYFSIWSPCDRLYDGDTQHWCGERQQIRGYITVDETVYCFMGDREGHPVMEQVWVDISAVSTTYHFENGRAGLTVCFTSPLLQDDPALLSRPCTYIDFWVDRKTDADVRIELWVSSDLVRRKKDELIGGSYRIRDFGYAYMGRAASRPLCHSGDSLTIDWGFVYLASKEERTALSYDRAGGRIGASVMMGRSAKTAGLVIAYDDQVSINYFGQWRKAYWTEKYGNILEAIGASLADRKEVLERCAVLELEIQQRSEGLGGTEYAFLCNLSYRQAIAAHKLITDEDGQIIFLSKENDSNGCIGTVDVSYPSVPLFLLYNTEYVKGMLRPVFRFARCAVWEYGFAPHDVGRYPYAVGQVCALNKKEEGLGYNLDSGNIPPFYYMYPGGCGIYDLADQMPVEECGNMLIMTAAVCETDGCADFAAEYYEELETWAGYLLEHGGDPKEQLCTDDFAGHLSHNVNLAAKAVLGIEAFSRIAGLLGKTAAASQYHEEAVRMARGWEARADAGDHYSLAFDRPDSWSLKYNLVWDLFFGSGLFSEDVFRKESDYYMRRINRYGVPLDCRREYTKSDWTLWCAAMAPERAQSERLMACVADFVRETPDRVPFSDWYDTVSGHYCHFKARSVQGGLFMPILIEERRKS